MTAPVPADPNHPAEQYVHIQGGLDLLQPCRAWPEDFMPLDVQQLTDFLTIAAHGAPEDVVARYEMTTMGVRQGNLAAAKDPTGRIAVMPTLKGQRRLN